jgi:ubiquinone/menaquinone biosynthesis C-methylase UbiE
MSYTIDERNPERQHLLNAVLDPTTREVLARLLPMPGARCLDLRCGHGNTTRCLADVLEPASCIGPEYDAALVDYASTRAENPQSVRFQQGDATQLPFEDASFDIVFCRYLLIHMADPLKVVREMMRVVRPGGFAVAYERTLRWISVRLRPWRWPISTGSGTGSFRILRSVESLCIIFARPEPPRFGQAR